MARVDGSVMQASENLHISVGFAADFFEPIAPCASETKHTSIFNITLMAILSSARRKLLYMIDFLFKQGFVIFAS